VDPFSYLSVLISIILALGMIRVLAGVGEMLQARSRRQIYWVHAVWIVNLSCFWSWRGGSSIAGGISSRGPFSSSSLFSCHQPSFISLR
jgi:hypothetical protein